MTLRALPAKASADEVRALQSRLVRVLGLHDSFADGADGPLTARAVARDKFIVLGYADGRCTPRAGKEYLDYRFGRRKVSAPMRERAEARQKAQHDREHDQPFLTKVYLRAVADLGIVEQGGNNRGAAVERIIRLGGGNAGEAWCAWFVRYLLGLVGWTGANPRGYAGRALNWLTPGPGLTVLSVADARAGRVKRGMLVVFGWGHIGVVEDIDGDDVISVDGNSGATNISDNPLGTDGVGRHRRSLSLVAGFADPSSGQPKVA